MREVMTGKLVHMFSSRTRFALSCWTMPLVGGFSRGSPFPPPLHSGASPYSPHFTFIGSKDLDMCRTTFGITGSALASHQGEPGSIQDGVTPVSSRVVIVPGRCRWSARFLPPFHFGAAPYSPQSSL
ncbi:hypothetical protein PR048_019596 [Dryococelus australis]|uniref:Secreted protein n=1 Tax=Dryococelus australis TaxID=614101 RepID=A0ABQ9H3Y1_9NEOP|nr:hypothetical protein PR048_019596 [Dryococelus australis]